MSGLPDDRRRIVIGVAAAVGLAGLLFGGWVWWQARPRGSTDDAYVEGAIMVISSKVSGNVSEVLVADNQAVKAGDLLLRVDPRDYSSDEDAAKEMLDSRWALQVGQRAVRLAEMMRTGEDYDE